MVCTYDFSGNCRAIRLCKPEIFEYRGFSPRITANSRDRELSLPQFALVVLFLPRLLRYTPGAELRSFKTLSEALVNLGLLLEKKTGPAYIHLYFDKVDTLCHEYGPNARQTEAEIETFLLIMEHYFERTFNGKKRILFLMTADHGASEVDPQTTTYLNTNPRFAGLERFLKTNLKGQLLVPAGSARDMFLYIKDDLLDEAQSFLATRL